MKRTTILLTMMAAAVAAHGALVCERWAGRGVPATHANALKVEKDATGVRLVVDLSALPAEALVVHASLFCSTAGDVQPTEPARLVPPNGKPLCYLFPRL